MLQYPGLCYLDLHKAGSSFVRRFLTDHVWMTPVRDERHQPLPKSPMPLTFCFASCRDPLGLYASLYRYGCQGGGSFRANNEAADVLPAELYDQTRAGFCEWLSRILDPRVELVVAPGIGGLRPDLIGLQSARFLALSMRKPQRHLADATDTDDVLRAFARHRLAREIVWTETLRADLARLARGWLRPFLRSSRKAVAALENQPQVNRSRHRFSVRAQDLPERLVAQLEARDRLFFDGLGYRRYTAG